MTTTAQPGAFRAAVPTYSDQRRELALPGIVVLVGPDPLHPHLPYVLPLAVVYGNTVRAVHYYTGQVIGRAGGSGYDRRAVAVMEAARRAFDVPPFDGARGFSAVRDHLAAHGVTMRDLSEICGRMGAEVSA